MKTIKQIADEIGVSKTAVRKKIENLEVSEKVQTIGNRIMVDEDLESLIKSAFQKKETETRKPKTVSENRILSDLVSVLQDELKHKNEEIEQLNARLAETTAALVSAQQALQAAQALHAGTIKQLEETSEKKGFFARLFKR